MNALSLLLTAAVITQQPAPASGASLARLLAEQAHLAALQAPSAAQLGAELTQLQALLAPSAAQLSELSRLQTLQAPSAVQAADLARLAAAQVEWSAVQLAAAAGLDFDDQQDSAFSLWSAARRALNRGEYTNAANLFDDFTRRYAASRYAGDAHYWGAFALYRTGDDQNLRRALTVLDAQKRRYPQALTARDAPTLRVRILTALAASICIRPLNAAMRMSSSSSALGQIVFVEICGCAGSTGCAGWGGCGGCATWASSCAAV